MPTSSDQQPLKHWVAEQTGSALTGWDRVPGGASRLSFRASVADGRAFFVRVDSGAGPLSGTHYDLAREKTVLAALQQQGFPVPALHAWSPEMLAILMEEVPGTPGPEGLENPALQRALLESVVTLQRLPRGVSIFPGAIAGISVGDAIHAELDLWKTLYEERVSTPEPAIDLALLWLKTGTPDADRPAVPVHGDIGPGNFLFQGSQIRGLIDWELAHPGHPLEDLACIIARSLGAPFGDNIRHVEYFGQLYGKPVDRVALEYCLVLVLARFCIGIQMALSRPSAALDVPMLILFRQVNIRALTGILARHFNITIPEPSIPAPSLPGVSDLYTYLNDTLEEVISPELGDNSFLARKMHGLQTLTLYLRELALYGCDRYAQEEILRIGELLGEQQPELATARQALRAAVASPAPPPMEASVRYLAWRCQREQRLTGPGAGDLADRTLVY